MQMAEMTMDAMIGSEKSPNSGIHVLSNSTSMGEVEFWVHCQQTLYSPEMEYTEVMNCLAYPVCGAMTIEVQVPETHILPITVLGE